MLSLGNVDELPVAIEDNPLQEYENPLDKDRVASNETMLISNIQHQFDNKKMSSFSYKEWQL